MKKKKKKYSFSSKQQFDWNKPKFNGYATGHGPHKNQKEKRANNWDWRNEV